MNMTGIAILYIHVQCCTIFQIYKQNMRQNISAGLAGRNSEVIASCLAAMRTQVIIKSYVITNIYINVVVDGLIKEQKYR